MSMFFGNRLNRIVRAPEGDGTGGGGGGGGTPDAKDKEIADLKAKLAEAEKAKGTQPPPKQDDPTDLAAKAAKDRKDAEDRASHEKNLESSIRFTSGAAAWVKENASLLPKNVESIITAAEKENYGSTIQKASAVKEAVVLEFFSVQANLDLLTASQKSTFDEFKSLTKDKRLEKAQSVYDSIFEPTFETLKKVKRAEQVSKGFKDESQGEQAYRDKRLKMARKQHLGEKN